MLNEEFWRNLALDLSPFADLGTSAPEIFNTIEGFGLRMVRNSDRLTISNDANGKLLVETESGAERFLNVKSMLAAPKFGNLASWARNQRAALAPFSDIDMIKSLAQDRSGHQGDPLDLFENFFSNSLDENPRLRIVFFDGPAGIGKTTFLQNFAYQRSKNYLVTQKPIVLHIQSKGKLLQNIFDLIALNLQSIRANVTFDQIPTLTKHGLVTIAIDGFDELGDPNGYELAWSQLNDFIVSVRGEAQIILSGRETFVSEETMLKALPAVDEKSDQIGSLSILPTAPSAARNWLRARSWTEEALDDEEIRDLLSPGSFAMRPFFLHLLGAPGISAKLVKGEVDELLPFLLDELLNREATKFGEDVDRLVSFEQRRNFIVNLMTEVARDLADNQSDNISSTNLAWLSDVASYSLPEEIRGILRNRANVIAFLTEDGSPSRLRFFHENAFHYWLAKSLFESFKDGEVPKYVRRNILNIDFLDVWNTVCALQRPSDLSKIRAYTFHSFAESGERDRTRRNLIALYCAASSVFPDDDVRHVFRDATVEEMIFRETSSKILLQNIFISQLDARGADLTGVEFDNCHIHTAVVDKSTKISGNFPPITILVSDGQEFTDRDKISRWVFQKTSSDLNIPQLLREVTSQIPELQLLQKLARFRRYWIKEDEDDPAARKILNDPSWERLSRALISLDFMVASDNLAASGRPAIFYHLKRREAFQDFGEPSDELVALLKKLAEQQPE